MYQSEQLTYVYNLPFTYKRFQFGCRGRYFSSDLVFFFCKAALLIVLFKSYKYGLIYSCHDHSEKVYLLKGYYWTIMVFLCDKTLVTDFFI